MNTSHSRRISRNAAEQLLDGQAGPDSDRLTRVLAAATAPVRAGELSGEQMAVAAFEANHLVPVATSHREHNSMLARLLTAKVLVTSLAAFATGGVALAASTGAMSGPGSAPATASPPAAASTPSSLFPSASPAPVSTGSAQPGGAVFPQPSSPAQDSPSASPAGSSLPKTAAALCQALAGDVTSVSGGALSPSGMEQALTSGKIPALLNNNQEFSSLVSTAQSAANVPDYCALLLDLPELPQPADLAQLPSTLLGQLLTALPTSTLTQVLTSLPSATLGQVLTALPTSALSKVLTELPSSTVSQLLNELPTSTLNQLPNSVLSQLPNSVLSQLPSSVLGGL